jgi:cell division protein FtsB
MKQAVRALWIIISIALVVQLVHSIKGLRSRGSVIEDARARLQKVKDENASLKDEALFAQSPEFVEEQARNKLNMARKGEVVALIPKASPTPTPTAVIKKQNWELWMEKFQISL